MALNYVPLVRTLVVCDYSTGFKVPEMVKRRLAVVVGPRLPQRADLATVVPLSTSPSSGGIRYQCKIELNEEPPEPYEGVVKWVKADMIAAVSLRRLDLPRYPGSRTYMQHRVSDDQLRQIHECILHSLELGHLTEHL